MSNDSIISAGQNIHDEDDQNISIHNHKTLRADPPSFNSDNKVRHSTEHKEKSKSDSHPNEPNIIIRSESQVTNKSYSESSEKQNHDSQDLNPESPAKSPIESEKSESSSNLEESKETESNINPENSEKFEINPIYEKKDSDNKDEAHKKHSNKEKKKFNLNPNKKPDFEESEERKGLLNHSSHYFESILEIIENNREKVKLSLFSRCCCVKDKDFELFLKKFRFYSAFKNDRINEMFTNFIHDLDNEYRSFLEEEKNKILQLERSTLSCFQIIYLVKNFKKLFLKYKDTNFCSFVERSTQFSFKIFERSSRNVKSTDKLILLNFKAFVVSFLKLNQGYENNDSEKNINKDFVKLIFEEAL